MFKFKSAAVAAITLCFGTIMDAQDAQVTQNARVTQNTQDAQVARLAQTVRKLEYGIFSDCQFSMMAMWEDGQEIAGLNVDRKMSPASNLKAITTGTALCALGEDFKWPTQIAYSGNVSSEGVLDGNLYIIGGGDPLMGSKVKGTLAIEHDFAQWLQLLRREGIVRINGHVIGDGSRLEGMREDPSWQYGDLGTYYGTCLSALNFYENRQDFIAVPGACAGDGVNITASYPETPWMKWDFSECHTGEKGTGDKLYLYLTDGGRSGVMRGTLSVDRGKKTVMCRNHFPEYTLANEFCKYLEARNISVEKGPAGLPFQPVGSVARGDVRADVGGVARGDARADALKYIGTTWSIPLSFIVKHTNEVSDNLCAELMFRTMGRHLEGSSDIEPSRKAVIDVLRDSLRLDAQPSQIVVADGSGLSSHNLVSARFMCRYLQKMLQSRHGDTFVDSLHGKMQGRVKAKTGSFKGCRTLCGYVLPATPEGKKIIFSIMVNNSHLSVWTIDHSQRQILSQLCEL